MHITIIILIHIIKLKINIKMMYVALFVWLFMICSQSIQVISTKNQYEIRRPLRYQYYRLNIKTEINPLISHLGGQYQRICSSKLGPFCELGRQKTFMEYKLSFDQYNQNEQAYYQIEKFYLPQRKKLAEKIIKGEENVFMIPSQEYKKIDAEVRANIKSLMYDEELRVPTQKQRADAYYKKKAKEDELKQLQQEQLKQRQKQEQAAKASIKTSNSKKK